MKLEGKVAIVAGGGQGIGEGIAVCLAEEGADIAVVDINSDTADKVVQSVEEKGRKALAISADLTDAEEVNAAVKKALDHFGTLDILVNNVGGASEEMGRMEYESRMAAEDKSFPPFMYQSPELWDKQYHLNLKSHVMMSQAVARHFIKQQSGKIVNISSVSGRLPEIGVFPYAAMKAGDISITWSLARSLAPYNINVNCICPGFVYTPLWERGAVADYNGMRAAKAEGRLPERFADIDQLSPKELWLRKTVRPITPLGREQTTEDMGRTAVFLVSEDAKNITGQVLHVDGGRIMR